jgi:3',5'-cyclic AMP phosphodiesterase CpdA
MKIAVCSDVHLEFGPISLENTENADVLILSGDICVASGLKERDTYNVMGENDKSNQFHTFFQECSSRFPAVIYIAGNHEHYHGDYAKSIGIIRDRLGYLVNVHVLDKESVILNGHLFIGGTLWTDMNKEDPVTLNRIKDYMNDYRIIENSNEQVSFKVYKEKLKPVGMTDEEWLAQPYDSRVVMKFETRPAKFSPEESIKDHKAMLEYIKNTIDLNPNVPVVVVGHHSPSKLSVKPRYKGDVVVNGAYSSDLSEFILDHPQIKLWTHGHTHDVFDYMIGTTRIVCNPRGYIGYEDRAEDFNLKFLEI